jgi:hypothetical protein
LRFREESRTNLGTETEGKEEKDVENMKEIEREKKSR